ncbi:hypothetical protein V8B97DRAFT_2023571 [Scleroderma yunnanense]
MPAACNCDAVICKVLQLDLLAKISTSNRAVLELDNAGQLLQVWPWPVNDQGQCVTLSDLTVHCLSHQFLGPQCLCMLANYPHDTHKEVAMHAGEYIACCTVGRCEYLGPDKGKPEAIYFQNTEDVNHNTIPRWQSSWNGHNNPFSKCQHCELIMTKRRIDSHECTGMVARMRVVIDLTQD